MLGGRAQRMFDAAAVETVDRLELVERDDDGALALAGELTGKQEDFVGEAIHIACGRHLRKCDREPPEARFFRFVANLRTRRDDRLGKPRPCALPFRFDGGNGPRIALEEGEVRAVAADGEVDGERSTSPEGIEG